MDTLTLETIRNAQAKDIEAVTEVVKATEKRIKALAAKAAVSADQREEFEQVARIAAWEAIDRFSGDSVDAFFAFMHRTAETTIKDAARIEKNQGATGADHDALKTYRLCLEEAKGDHDLAEMLCQTHPKKGRRLSADRAHAARLAFEGPVSLDMQNGEDGASFADMIASDYGVPDDLVEASDLAAEQRDNKVALVRAIIAKMGEKQATILRARWGIDPSTFLGRGADADEILAEMLSTKPGTVRVLRNQAHKSFASRYTKVTGLTPCECNKCESHRRAEGVSL
ncbi:sigma factor [Streptomyces sp. NRRL S-475]|uniref:sigma factor n=1 Tax=Streptomyces sp. NRRL S-475 TaxID=1463910 RepID=UPI00067D40FB|nr:sigma factor [Streptomyces sp. NRRL S-475]